MESGRAGSSCGGGGALTWHGLKIYGRVATLPLFEEIRGVFFVWRDQHFLGFSKTSWSSFLTQLFLYIHFSGPRLSEMLLRLFRCCRMASGIWMHECLTEHEK